MATDDGGRIDSQIDGGASGEQQPVTQHGVQNRVCLEDYGPWAAEMLQRLGTNKFRAKFVLSDKDRAYARAKGKATIDRHAHEMLAKRVGPAEPYKDGRQTPWRGHPVFTAQHATATCCRGCIEKWHHIPQGRKLTDEEVDRLATLVMAWIERDLVNHPVR